MEKLGKFLVKKNIITEFELGEALEIQHKTHSPLSRILLSEGFSNSLQLYQAIAEYEQVPFANLITEAVDANLVSLEHKYDYLSLSCIPWKKDGEITLIATSDINDDVELWARQHYKDAYKFVLTSPFDINHAVNILFLNDNNEEAREKLWQLSPQSSAKYLLKGIQTKLFLGALITFAVVFFLSPYAMLAYSFLVINLFYVATLLFKLILFIVGKFYEKRTRYDASTLDDNELPIYTILVPLYKEERTLAKLVSAIRDIDYPRSKLDVKLIVEDDDGITINAIKALKCERMFEIVKVPFSIPRTKPKACNYALSFARGEYVTIYDAEDIPDPMQLKKVLGVFEQSHRKVVCAQARLNYFNREENLLTRLFSIEYSSLFDYLLYGAKAINIPILLGGTSNHFKMKALQEAYAWDPYNVTEDADLGIRIAQKGWQVALVDSVTLEEAPISLTAWVKQRSRWIKGHMQTYLVHMRHPLKLKESVGLVGFMGMQLFLGAPVFIFLISPFMWGLSLLFWLEIIPINNLYPQWFESVVLLAIMLLFISIMKQIMLAAFIVEHKKWDNMTLSVLTFPFYWLLHSVASFRALWQLIFRPQYWEKTEHGQTRMDVKESK